MCTCINTRCELFRTNIIEVVCVIYCCFLPFYYLTFNLLTFKIGNLKKRKEIQVKTCTFGQFCHFWFFMCIRELSLAGYITNIDEGSIRVLLNHMHEYLMYVIKMCVRDILLLNIYASTYCFSFILEMVYMYINIYVYTHTHFVPSYITSAHKIWAHLVAVRRRKR